MKLAYLCSVLLLAGAVSSSAIDAEVNGINVWGAEQKIDLPDWIVDLIDRLPESIQDLINRLPETIQEIIDRIPEIIDMIPDLIDRIPELIDFIIDTVPGLIADFIDRLPEILAQYPAAIDQLNGIIQRIIDRVPEYIPLILETIPDVIALIPQIYERIREILESFDLPDWFPVLPEFETPEWWPIELPQLPEINRAVPGTLTSVSEFPGVVQVEVGTGPIWSQGCVGTIMTNFHILTSARCNAGRFFQPRFRRVRAGSSMRYEGGSTTAVSSALIHPDFQGYGNFEADLSIMTLSSSLLLGGDIQQIPIVSQGFNLPAGMSAELVGWGTTAQGSLNVDRNLYKIDLTVVDTNTCAESWSRIPPFTITSNMMCLARPESGGRNADIRDMGAAVVFQNAVVGIMSLGVPVGNHNFEVITTPIGPYSDWIRANAA